MTNSNKPKRDEPKTVALTVINTADLKNKRRTGITLRAYKELSTKDRLTLTPSEQKSLAEAQQQARKMIESLTSQYDFSAIGKLLQSYAPPPIAQQALIKALAINTTPMLKIAADMQKLSLLVAQPALAEMLDIQKTIMPAIQAIYKSTIFTQNQFTALAAIQKSLVTFPTENILASIKGIQDAFQAPLIARTMFADFHNMHERILRSLQIDIGSLTASIEFSRFETVGVTLDDVTTNDDNLTATVIATQTNSVGNVTFVDNASLVFAFNDLRQEVHDLRQQLLARDSQQGQQLIAPSTVSFKRSTSSIQIGSYKVSVSISSKQAQFARTVLTTQETIGKRWDIEDLILAAFGERIANDEQDWIIKVRSYIFQFNQKVMLASGSTMPNYLILEGIEVFVNPEYL
jgi:hypothetical protein